MADTIGTFIANPEHYEQVNAKPISISLRIESDIR